MSTILNSEIISNAKSSVSTYVSTANALKDELDSLINTLTSAGFIGDASTGYKEFYNKYVVPAIFDNLTVEGSSLTASITSMLETIETQLINTVDPQLGDFNRNPNQG